MRVCGFKSDGFEKTGGGGRADADDRKKKKDREWERGREGE